MILNSIWRNVFLITECFSCSSRNLVRLLRCIDLLASYLDISKIAKPVTQEIAFFCPWFFRNWGLVFCGRNLYVLSTFEKFPVTYLKLNRWALKLVISVERIERHTDRWPDGTLGGYSIFYDWLALWIDKWTSICLTAV